MINSGLVDDNHSLIDAQSAPPTRPTDGLVVLMMPHQTQLETNHGTSINSNLKHRLYGTKVCRCSWHSAGSLGWPLPVLKYKYLFRLKYTKAIFFIKQHSETVMV